MVNISLRMGYEIRGNRLGDDAEWCVKQRGAAGRTPLYLYIYIYITSMKLTSGE